MILYYSGCGNSQFVAEQLAEKTGEKLVKMHLKETASYTLQAGETVGIVCPIYSWAVPRVVEAYLRRMHVEGQPGYCYLACTYGDSLGKAPERFAKTLKQIGWTLDACYGFVMPETYVNLKAFKLDSAEGASRKIDAVRERLPKVAAQIARKEKVTDVVRGKVPWLNTYVTNALFYALLITDRKFKVGESCVGCGECADHCPMGNITMENGKPRWHGECTNCMSCYHRCPQNAIQFGSATEGKGQYRFGKI